MIKFRHFLSNRIEYHLPNVKKSQTYKNKVEWWFPGAEGVGVGEVFKSMDLQLVDE